MKDGRRMSLLILLMPILAGCSAGLNRPEQMLTIRWQRLVDDTGRTCRRCGLTQAEVRLAADTLRQSLRPLNMRVVLEETPMSAEVCARDILQSNRIWLNDRSLEEWLGAKTGMSPCGGCCGEIGKNVKCRTLIVGEQTYEAVPAVLIVRAGLLAAEAGLAKRMTTKPCCPPPET